MTASLYHSGSTIVSRSSAAMWLTFAAQTALRNARFRGSRRTLHIAHGLPPREAPRDSWASKTRRNRARHGLGCHPENFRDQLKSNVPTSTEGLALPYQCDLTGDALPVAASVHPGVGKAISAIKCLAIFTCAFFIGRSHDNCHARTVHVHIEFLGLHRGIGVCITLRLSQHCTAILNFSLGIYANEISSHHRFDGCGVMFGDSGRPAVFIVLQHGAHAHFLS